MNEPLTYLTLSDASYGEYKEKGSKFYAHAYPVETDTEISEKTEALRKEFHDARHHCYAWVMGTGTESFRVNDDGEPAHSAGDPILGQIRSFGLTNVLIVVVRYFGGTKLGVGGLINAYRTAARIALGNGKVVEREVTCCFDVRYGYESTSEVLRLFDNFSVHINSQDFAEACVAKVSLNVSLKEEFVEQLILLKKTGRDVTARKC